jgi:hypothetical protein
MRVNVEGVFRRQRGLHDASPAKKAQTLFITQRREDCHIGGLAVLAYAGLAVQAYAGLAVLAYALRAFMMPACVADPDGRGLRDEGRNPV